MRTRVKVPGAVPFLEGKIKAYAGEVMSPFEPVTVAVAAGQARTRAHMRFGQLVG